MGLSAIYLITGSPGLPGRRSHAFDAALNSPTTAPATLLTFAVYPCPNEIGDVSVTIVLGSLHSVCERCYHRENREHKIWLCSPKCLTDFLAEGKLDREVGIANGTIRPWEAEIDPVNGA